MRETLWFGVRAIAATLLLGAAVAVYNAAPKPDPLSFAQREACRAAEFRPITLESLGESPAAAAARQAAHEARCPRDPALGWDHTWLGLAAALVAGCLALAGAGCLLLRAGER